MIQHINHGLPLIWKVAMAALIHLQNQARLAPRDAVAQAAVMRGLATLAADTARRADMVEGGALATLVEAMRGHPDAAEVQAHACTTLWYLAGDSTCRRDIMASGAVPLALSALTSARFRSFAAVHAAGAAFFWVMTDESASRPRLLASGALDAVVEALRTFIASAPDVAWPCLGFLWNVSQDASTRPAIAALGALELGLAAMRNHVRNQDVCLAGCGFMWNMTDEARWRSVVAEHNGAELLVEVMRAHPKVLAAPHNFTHCAAVQIHALGALVNVTSDAAVRPHVVASRAIDAILVAMDAHVTLPDVQLQACAVLGACVQKLLLLLL